MYIGIVCRYGKDRVVSIYYRVDKEKRVDGCQQIIEYLNFENCLIQRKMLLMVATTTKH